MNNILNAWNNLQTWSCSTIFHKNKDSPGTSWNSSPLNHKFPHNQVPSATENLNSPSLDNLKTPNKLPIQKQQDTSTRTSNCPWLMLRKKKVNTCQEIIVRVIVNWNSSFVSNAGSELCTDKFVKLFYAHWINIGQSRTTIEALRLRVHSKLCGASNGNFSRQIFAIWFAEMRLGKGLWRVHTGRIASIIGTSNVSLLDVSFSVIYKPHVTGVITLMRSCTVFQFGSRGLFFSCWLFGVAKCIASCVVRSFGRHLINLGNCSGAWLSNVCEFLLWTSLWSHDAHHVT